MIFDFAKLQLFPEITNDLGQNIKELYFSSLSFRVIWRILLVSIQAVYGSFIYIHRTYILQLIAHLLISACTTGVGRAHNSWYASAQQLLCGWRYRLLRLITLILPATSKGYSEDFLRKTDATMIVLTRHDDSTYKQQR